MAGRWIMYDNGAWDFKIDNDRMGSAVDCSSIKGVCGLKDSILDAYGLLGREIEVEMCYWLIDGESEMLGKGAAPVEIATDTDYKIFKALHRTDKSFIVFVTFREIVGGEMIFLRSERDIFTQTNATAIIVDDDENLIRQVEANEAAIGLNFEATEVGGSKDSRAAADGVCGVNLEAENIRQQSCVEQILVQRRKNKQANVEAASGDDIGNVAGCAVMDVDKRKVRCALTFETATVETVDVAAVTPQQQKKKHNRVIEDDDKFVDPPLTETAKVCNSTRASDETHSADSDQYTKHNRVIEADDEFVDPHLTETGNVCNSTSACDEKLSGDEKDTGESDDAVLVTPPKQYNKHNRVIEADDGFVDPPLTEPAKVCNSTSACDEKLSGDEKETGESDDVVLATPPKQYNKHNRVIEADDEFVDPPIIQTTEFDGGEAFTLGKHIPSTYVFEDDDLFVDPPVIEGMGVQGGEAFMKGIQVSEMYGYDDVFPVFNVWKEAVSSRRISTTVRRTQIYMLEGCLRTKPSSS
ncbi:hypothetical protein YC2023_049092 [Brassica napus]